VSLLEARNGEEALQILCDNSVDVLFLDINMPGLTGLSVASTLMDMPDPPLLVFATAYDDYAVKAFDLEALDYVVKPFAEKRLEQTLNRVRHALEDKDQFIQRQENLKNYLKKNQGPRLNKLWAERENENRLLLDYQDIYWLEAEDKKVYAHTFAEKLLVRYTLKELEDHFLEQTFVRVHKANIINLNHISEIVPWFSGNYLIRMNDQKQTEVSMSRRYAVQLKELTGWR
jgi:DNA-binding LytR/AlgR family response regulator